MSAETVRNMPTGLVMLADPRMTVQESLKYHLIAHTVVTIQGQPTPTVEEIDCG